MKRKEDKRGFAPLFVQNFLIKLFHGRNCEQIMNSVKTFNKTIFTVEIVNKL